MHRSSETIGAIAAALAKAQADLENPERTLLATIPARDGAERSFRYASLANGLELVRKCLGRHEIAVMQATAIEEGQIILTTLLVHASGEWVSSVWPVCAAAEPSAPVKGAALTYARRYALFALVGIAGEDDLDAPDLVQRPKQPSPEPPLPRRPAKIHAPRPAPPTPEQSAPLREQLQREMLTVPSEEALAVWAHRALPLKDRLTDEDAKAVEASYLARLAEITASGRTTQEPAETSASNDNAPTASSSSSQADDPVTRLPKAERKRSKAHLAFVACQPCVVCKALPCDAHHLKIARPRSLGRKVSDEFTVPLCRAHHQELHQHGNEASWWANLQIAPLPIALDLWNRSPARGAAPRSEFIADQPALMSPSA